jgi:hypothetical protein
MHIPVPYVYLINHHPISFKKGKFHIQNSTTIFAYLSHSSSIPGRLRDLKSNHSQWLTFDLSHTNTGFQLLAPSRFLRFIPTVCSMYEHPTHVIKNKIHEKVKEISLFSDQSIPHARIFLTLFSPRCPVSRMRLLVLTAERVDSSWGFY